MKNRKSRLAMFEGRAIACQVGVLVACGILAAMSVACQGGEVHMSDEKKQKRLERMYKKYQRKFPEVESISVAELQELQAGEGIVVLVDVRKPEEYEVSMLPGAITKVEFEARRDEFRGATVVPYCTAGYRSGFYARQLMEEGFEVKNLAGSVLAWSHAGRLFVHDGDETKRVHTYSSDWNLAAEGYEAVWGDGPPE